VKQTQQRSILLVEDDALLAMDIEVVLQAAGYRVMGPAATTAEATTLLHRETPDLAVLDLNLGTEMSFAVFDYLARINVPFIILTGHSPEMVPVPHAHRAVLQKPYELSNLLQIIHKALHDGGGARVSQAG
jgi:DNA-binding response OmpR family regulator